MGRKPRLTEHELVPLIHEHKGNFTKIAARVGVPRTAIQLACARFEGCKLAVAEVRQARLDKALDILEDALDSDEHRERWPAAMVLYRSAEGRIRLYGRDEQAEFAAALERMERALGMVHGFDPREL